MFTENEEANEKFIVLQWRGITYFVLDIDTHGKKTSVRA